MSHITTPHPPTLSASRGLHKRLAKSSAARIARLLALLTGAALLSGWGSCSDGTADSPPPDACLSLRPLDIGQQDSETLDAEHQKRRSEVCQYVAQQDKAAGYQFVFTSRTPLGDTWDWALASSVPGSDKVPPPMMTLEEIQAQLPEGAQLQHMEIEDYPDLQGPPGTIPFLRPTFSAYVAGGTGATSLDDWISNYQVSGAPSDPNRLYAGVRSIVDNQGANVTINSYGGEIEQGTLSNLEMAVGCRVNGVMRQQVGIAAIRDNVNRDRTMDRPAGSVLRLGVEFYSAGPDKKGPGYFNWDRVTGVNDFKVPHAPFTRPYGPGACFSSSTISTVGGTQYQSFYQIILKDGDWWVAHNGHLLGYYPSTLFEAVAPINLQTPPNLIASKACEVDWYGEVYAQTPVPWTTTPMGSGRFASDGWPNAAYFMDLSYVADPAAPPVGPPPNVTSDVSGSNDACYSKTPLTLGPAPWNWFFYAGGPGGAVQGCTGPKP